MPWTAVLIRIITASPRAWQREIDTAEHVEWWRSLQIVPETGLPRRLGYRTEALHNVRTSKERT